MKREQRGPLPPAGGYQPRERGRGTGAVDTLRETSMAEGRRKTPPRPREETDDRRSAKQHSEQQALHWALAENRTDQLPVPIEAGRAADQGLHVIRREHQHDRVELTVAEPREEASEPDRRSQLRCQAFAPPLLVAAEKDLVEPPLLEAFDQGLGGQRRAQEAVEDAATRRRLRETARVADRERSEE